MVEVLFHDNHLLILNKPPGLLTQPTEEESDSLEEQAKAWLRKEKGKDVVFLKSLHRLDRDASGIVIFAVSSKGATRMAEEFREGRVDKLYMAELEGIVQDDTFSCEHYHVKEHQKAKLFREKRPGSKLAKLKGHVLKILSNTTLVEVDLLTGRYHQIRAQMAAMGHPIVGDTKYGAKPSAKCGGICLHHKKVRFIHPISKSKITIETAKTGF